MRLARLTLIFAAAFAALYAAYWVLGAQAARMALPAWAEERRAEGWQVEWQDLRLRGFPSRFDTTLEAPAFADPGTGWAWQAPFLQVFALSYRPGHVIVVWPETQRLDTVDGSYAVATEDMRASLVVRPTTELPIQRGTVVIEGLRIEAPEGPVAARRVQLSLRETPEASAPHTYDLALLAEGLAPGEAVTDQLGPEATALPRALERVSGDATVTFDAPWDRDALEERRPQPRQVTLRDARAVWGALELRLAGELDIDEAGRPTGEIAVQARNWREMVAMAETAGVLAPAIRPLVEGALASFARFDGSDETLDSTITISRGRAMLGFFPLGEIGPLVLR